MKPSCHNLYIYIKRMTGSIWNNSHSVEVSSPRGTRTDRLTFYTDSSIQKILIIKTYNRSLLEEQWSMMFVVLLVFFYFHLPILLHRLLWMISLNTYILRFVLKSEVGSEYSFILRYTKKKNILYIPGVK